MDEEQTKEKLCPKCGTDIIMTTGWDGKLQPEEDKCSKCGYSFKKAGFLGKMRSFFKWSGS